MKDNPVPRPTTEEYKELKESIQKHGQLIPIIQDQHGLVRDGITREQVCAELGIKPKYQVKHFDDEPSALLFAIEVNLRRRSLTQFQKYELVKPLMKVEAELAKKRKQSGKHVPTLAQGRTVEKIAKKHGMGKSNLTKMQYIDKYGTPEIKAKVRSGKMSVNYGERMIKNKQYHETETPPLPKGSFNVIEMDFPWKYDLELSGAPDYHTMTLEEGMKEIPKLPAHKDCVLFKWVTNPKIEEALALVNFWGFKLKTSMFWVKTKNGKPEPDQLQVGTGHYVKGAHEMLWICIKGKPGTPHNIHQIPSVFFAPRGKHSVKPDLAYDIIKKMYPKATRLSMFSRTEREGWSVWGDQLKKK